MVGALLAVIVGGTAFGLVVRSIREASRYLDGREREIAARRAVLDRLAAEAVIPETKAPIVLSDYDRGFLAGADIPRAMQTEDRRREWGKIARAR